MEVPFITVAGIHWPRYFNIFIGRARSVIYGEHAGPLETHRWGYAPVLTQTGLLLELHEGRWGLWEGRDCVTFRGGSAVMCSSPWGSRERRRMQKPEPHRPTRQPHVLGPQKTPLSNWPTVRTLLSAGQVPGGHTSVSSSCLTPNIYGSPGKNTSRGPQTINRNISHLKIKRLNFTIMLYPSILTDKSS